MTNEEQIEAIKAHQIDPSIHPLTCGNDSRHELLEPIVQDGKVVLVCPTCKLVQENFPGIVLERTKGVKERFPSLWRGLMPLFCLVLLTGCEPPQPAPPPAKIIALSAETPEEDKQFVLGEDIILLFNIQDADPNCQIGVCILNEDKSNIPCWFVIPSPAGMVPYKALEQRGEYKSFRWKVSAPIPGKYYYFHWRMFPSATSFSTLEQPIGWANPIASGFSEKFFVKAPKLTLQVGR